MSGNPSTGTAPHRLCGASWHLGADVPAWLQAHRHAELGAVERLLIATSPDEVADVVGQAWQASLAGHWVCGYMTYEAAPAFDPSLPVAGASSVPLVVFLVASQVSSTAGADERQESTAGDFRFDSPWLFDDRFAVDRARSRMSAVREATAAGRYYQLNLTSALKARGRGDVRVLFDRMVGLQPVLYGFCLRMPDHAVVSASPELFFQWDGELIQTRPMKGTAAPSGDANADRALLQASTKDRAENVMIVDLLRNDLSRIAQPGSVSVPSLFDVHSHPTVVQMTSSVQARTRSGTTLMDILRALFPCGSVTGAPKHEAMSHIRELEGQPRGVYCGAVGLLAPGGKALFNVAIRTLVHSPATGELSYSVGSGLTWYSSPADEWSEWQWKSRLAHRTARAFEILETVRLQDGVWQRAAAHAQRMQGAAQAFGYAFSEDELQMRCAEAAVQHPSGSWRGRWLLSADGCIRIEVLTLDDLPVPLTLQYAQSPMDTCPGEWPFVRHKTTWRLPYDRHASPLPQKPDVLLHAADGSLLETPRGNVVVQDAEGLWTPDHHWQLPGVLQQALIAEGVLRRRRLTLDDLKQAQGVWVINSLRGWMPVERLVDAHGQCILDFPLKNSPA